ncbi:MAG TPA: hypothetical protein VFJ58_18535 [Armatimonadota bacterium]|nr:hypothetical protein [Armatimonadota bacterium]
MSQREVEGVMVDATAAPSGDPKFPFIATGQYRLGGADRESAVYGMSEAEAVENLMTFIGRVVRFDRGEGRTPPE